MQTVVRGKFKGGHHTIDSSDWCRAGLICRRPAIRSAPRARLETLAERIGAAEALDLAAQLPREVGHYLQELPPATPERLSFDDFCLRVATRETCDLPDAVFHARCVVETLEEAVSGAEVSHVIGLLPEEFALLFAGHEGKMPRRH